MERFKNYGLWFSIFAFVPLFCESFGLKLFIKPYLEIINSILGIIVLAGILSNPTTVNNGYLDDDNDEKYKKT